ncbi:transcription antitermination factor NusB [Prochlorococcus sp. AH-736-E02]|nr:transcription antitermination factor NusB [Prochlorococcus sp. AH-736-E02]
MHNNKSLSRELSLISLGLIKDKGDFKLNKLQIEEVFESALDCLVNHCRNELDNCESELENASQQILDSELQEGVDSSFSNVRDKLKKSLKKIEFIMNILSETLDFPRLIVSSGQIEIREDVNERISYVFNNLTIIDSEIDQVMDGWRLKRLPRIDRDILRLAYVDINFLNTPVAVACNEAVNLANKYSDMQGRKFINGVLRRLQTVKLP